MATRSAVAEDASLHARIDRLMERKEPGPAAVPASDAEYLRRISLDLIGMPPSIEELRAFLADKTPDKRARAVDRLMATPLFDRHLTTTLDVMLMERRPNTNIPQDDWINYLLGSVRENKPINVLFREIVAADGADAKLRPAARFHLDRGSEPNLITRDVGRIFFGRDMQCNQCHDHPVIEDYRQTDYHGLLAFFSPGYALTLKEGGKDKVVFAEKAGGSLAFDSVFVKNDKHVTGPRVPGEPECDEKTLPPGDEYEIRPADNVRPVPKMSRRAELAALATGGKNRAFNENVANRLWAMMLGRGLVHPVDLHHPANPASHPELMRMLGDELAASKFDARAFLREIALTKVYQQTFDPLLDPSASAESAADAVAVLKTLTATRKTESEAAAKTYSDAVKAWYAAETAMMPALAEKDKAEAKVEEVMKKRDPVAKALADARAAIVAKGELAKSLADAGAKAVEAAGKLPGEKDLADAAKKFVDRSAAFKTEIAALEKGLPEKTAALKKIDDERAAEAKLVEAARAKVKPFRDEVRRKEALTVAARAKMSETRVAWEQAKKKLASLEAFVAAKALEDRKFAAERAAASRRDALALAQKQANEFSATLTAKRTDVASAESVVKTTEAAKTKAQAALDRRTKAYESVVNAKTATEAALKQIEGDAALTEVASRLNARAAALKTDLAKPTADRDRAAEEAVRSAKALEIAKKALADANAEKARRDKLAGEALAALDAELARVKTLGSEIATARGELEQLWSDDFSIARLKPLSPEQMCWSIMKVSGVYDRYRAAEIAELDKTKPLSEADRKNPAALKEREAEVERRTFDKLKGNVPAFVSIYAAAAGQPQNDFFATADQALFAANGGSVNSWVSPAAGNVADRIVKEKDAAKAAEDLYLTVLSRTPTAEESADVVRTLADAKDRPAVARELVWSLAMSAEFRFNH